MKTKKEITDEIVRLEKQVVEMEQRVKSMDQMAWIEYGKKLDFKILELKGRIDGLRWVVS